MKPLFLNEAVYYGRNKYLIEVEKIFDNILKRYRVIGWAAGDYKDDLNKAFGILEGLFNFKKIKWSFSSIVNTPMLFTNAATLPVSLNYGILSDDKNWEIEESAEYGIRFKNTKHTTVIILTDGLFIASKDGAALLSIILHEIGHNFFLIKNFKKEWETYRSILNIYYIIRVIDYFIKKGHKFKIEELLITFIVLIENVCITLFKRSFILELEALITKIPGVSTLLKFEKLFKLPKYLFYFILSFPNALKNFMYLPIILSRGLTSAFLDSILFNAYANEKFSDTFATSLGYPVPFNEKFHPVERIPILNVISAIRLNLEQSLWGLGEVHPNIIKRTQMAVDHLEAVLKDHTISNKEKKEIKFIIESLKNKSTTEDNTSIYGWASKWPFKQIFELQSKIKDFASSTMPSIASLFFKEYDFSDKSLQEYNETILRDLLKEPKLTKKEFEKRIDDRLKNIK